MPYEDKALENAWNQSRTTRMKKHKTTYLQLMVGGAGLGEHEIKVGSKGQGKSKEQTDKLVEKLFAYNQYIPPYIPQDVYAPYIYGTTTGTGTGGQSSSTPQQPVKQQFNPDDHKGKFCAHVTLTYHDVEHTGILFVKQCGHWKLMEYNGNKLAGGTSGSFDALCKNGTLKITVLQVLFDADKPVVQPVSEGYGELDILDIIGETGLEIS